MPFKGDVNFDHMSEREFREMSAKGGKAQRGVPKPGSGNPHPNNRKWTDEERDRIVELVAVYDGKGLTQRQIAARISREEGLEVSQPSVSGMLGEIKARRKAMGGRDPAEVLEEKLEQYRVIRAAAWDAYERSEKDVMKEVEEFVAPLIREGRGKGRGADRGRPEETLLRLKLIRTRQGRLPASEYLRMIMDTLQAERDLLGIDAAKKVDVTSDNVSRTVSWVSVKPGERYVPPDDVEEKLKALEAQLPEQLKPKVGNE